jgi:predicted ribosomally synthesized peptide with SipW-like signal peptide
MKKKIVVICLCIALVATAAVSATLAYFTSTATVKNTFTMGDVKITLDETNAADPTGDRVKANSYDVYPGAVVTKDPIVHNTGKNDAYIRATVNVENWMNVCAACFPDFDVYYPNDGYEQSLLLLVDALGDGWSIVGVDAGTPFTIGNFSAVFTLMYDGTLASGEDTTAMFNEVTIPAALTSGESFPSITVKAEAIQADGFDSWEEAFAAFDGE